MEHTNSLYFGDDCPNCDASQSIESWVDPLKLEQGWYCFICDATFTDTDLTNKYREVIASLEIKKSQAWGQSYNQNA